MPPKARKPRAKTVTAAAAGGDRLELLVAVRSRVARAVQDPDTPARDLAALTRRLLEVAREIETLEAAAKKEAADGAVDDEPFDAASV